MRKLVIGVALVLLAAGAMADTAAKAVYDLRCAKCHGETGKGNPNALETVCEGVDPLKLTLAGSVRRTDADLRSRILDGADDMPAYREKLTTDQVDALVAYIRSLFSKAATPSPARVSAAVPVPPP